MILCRVGRRAKLPPSRRRPGSEQNRRRIHGPQQRGPGAASGLASQSRRAQRGPATPRVKDATVAVGPKGRRGRTGRADPLGSLAAAPGGEV